MIEIARLAAILYGAFTRLLTPRARTRARALRDGRDGTALSVASGSTSPLPADHSAVPSPGCDEAANRCTSRQRNTHSTESRDVRYPWHPWFGRSVTVYEALTKGGHAICRCGFDDQRNDRSLEVPAWMFESAACDHLRLTATPFVDCLALIELETVLRTARRADVLEAQHPSLTAGGADVTVQPPRTSLATDAVSSVACPPALSNATAGDPRPNDSPASPIAPSAGRANGRLR